MRHLVTHPRGPVLAMAILLLASTDAVVDGFSIHPTSQCLPTLWYQSSSQSRFLMVARQEPPVDGADLGDDDPVMHRNHDDNSNEVNEEDILIEMEHQKIEFRKLVDQVVTASKPEHIPSLLTKNTDLILKMTGVSAVETIESILEETRQSEKEEGKVVEAIEMILSFAEDFVDRSKTLDEHNKQLLGKIIMTMTQQQEGTSYTDREREEKLDELMAKERNNFTRGFLRHLDGQCQRIANAPSFSKDGERLLEILMTIKTRIVEELGKDLGEGAIVLGQLVAYEDRHERIAVLDAGLTVRGYEFAVELRALTEEALEGFRNVPGGADPTLVKRVEEIDQHVKKFLEANSTFQ